MITLVKILKFQKSYLEIYILLNSREFIDRYKTTTAIFKPEGFGHALQSPGFFKARRYRFDSRISLSTACREAIKPQGSFLKKNLVMNYKLS